MEPKDKSSYIFRPGGDGGRDKTAEQAQRVLWQVLVDEENKREQWVQLKKGGAKKELGLWRT